MRPPIQLVIFDWAGTTVDFGSCAPANAFLQAFASLGVAVSRDEARAPMGLHKKEHLRAMLRQPDLAERWRQRMGQPWNEADVDDLYRRVTPLQVKAARERADLTPGVLETMVALRSRGIRIGATTGYFREAASAVAAEAAKRGYVPDYSIGADEVPAGRPAPWMIFRVMEVLNAYPPNTVVKVGDTLVDIEDGLNAGAWSLGVVDSSNLMGMTREEFQSLNAEERESRREQVRLGVRNAGAHATIDALPDLLAWIDRKSA